MPMIVLGINSIDRANDALCDCHEQLAVEDTNEQHTLIFISTLKSKRWDDNTVDVLMIIIEHGTVRFVTGWLTSTTFRRLTCAR